MSTDDLFNGEGRFEDELYIRKMVLNDLPVVFDLGEKVFTPDKFPSLYRTWDEYELVDLFSSDGEYCLVAEYEEKICGFILGTIIDKRKSVWIYGHVLWIAVDPGYRRLDVARKLLDRLTNQMIEDGVRMMLVDTDPDNKQAMQFFKRAGYGKELRHVYMSRNLTRTAVYKKLRGD